ncbi:arylamine N-acetyltransferase family protein [Kitasatospora kifunensis]|uniref:N-hydroxyarylamine O-acetyltransferase n=1 Tax=Kitasatospora kifunensis TaxID=58351 RepID=A0A7W7R7V0_KITKI|nr:arylamine N-acetyltransferase [Kitasatospora kifunensis]MBB4926900.1 N-hydroxyarylamine O-acetyltransferase [Kitasatospora kifunensis]
MTRPSSTEDTTERVTEHPDSQLNEHLDSQLDEQRVAAYLARIGAQRPELPDLAGLRALQRAHLATVPFENLSVRLGEPIVLEPAALVAKLVDRRRGGFCYELNGAFAALLTALGYQVDLLAARVFAEERPGPPGPLFDHLALRVRLDEPWLVDVGFGRFSTLPLRLDERGEQHDPAGTFTIREHGPDLDVLESGTPQYRLDQRAYQLADFVPTCWWQATAPASPFTRSTVCSMATADGRKTLSGDKLIRTVDGERQEQPLPEPADRLAAYRDHFGIALDATDLERLD